MCAGYGLHGELTAEQAGTLPPLDERGTLEQLREWQQQRSGSARITGSKAINLNPVIHAHRDERQLELAWWWLWLDNSGPVEFSAFNSRDDKLLRSWKRPFQSRALLPATWYVEKKNRFHLPDLELFAIAAITHRVERDDGTELLTYSMVTRDAVGEAADTWHRMPLVLPHSLHDEWLSPDRAGDADLVAEALHASDEISRELTTGPPSGHTATLF